MKKDIKTKKTKTLENQSEEKIDSLNIKCTNPTSLLVGSGINISGFISRANNGWKEASKPAIKATSRWIFRFKLDLAQHQFRDAQFN